MTIAVEAILTVLNGMTPPRGSSLQSSFEATAEKWLKRSCWLAPALSLVAAGLGVFHVYFSKLPAPAMMAALYLAVAAVLIAMLGVLIGLAGALYGVRTLWDFDHRFFLLKVRSDAAHAVTLRAFDASDLKLARQCLELQVTRNRNRLNIFAGSPDKLALMAVIAVLWAVYSVVEARQLMAVPDFQTAQSWGAALFLAVLAMLAGLLAGAVALNIRTQRYIYQIELLDVAVNTALQ